jgi:hypothetical protein
VSAPLSVDGSTSTQRTHRYLRLAIGGTVVIVFVAILLVVPGAGWLSSISDYFYTPARNAFVGALIAASLALLALSGRDPERTILDAAALFAPLIALVPSVIEADAIPGIDVTCTPCVPPAYQPDVVNGVVTYLVVLAGVLVLGAALSRAGEVQGARLSLILGAGVFVVVLVTGVAFPEVFLGGAHFVATVVFFGLIAADALVNAFWRTTSETPPVWLRITYIVIAGVLVAALIVVTAATASAVFSSAADDGGEAFPWILFGEGVALLAFLAFWWLQTWQRWNESDPRSLLPMSSRLPPLRSS